MKFFVVILTVSVFSLYLTAWNQYLKNRNEKPNLWNYYSIVYFYNTASLGQKRVLIGGTALTLMLSNARIPNLRPIMLDRVWSLSARTVLPSSSAPNWASMVMGAGPKLHGYTKWGSQEPDLPTRELDEYGMFPSVYSVLRKPGPKSEIDVIY